MLRCIFKIELSKVLMMEQIVYFVSLILIIDIQIVMSMNSEPDYYRYLQQYGYTPKVEGRRLFSVVNKATYNDGIKTFQRLYKLPVTGELDDKTKKFMQRPRCGNPDLGTAISIRRPVNVDKPELASLANGRSAKIKEQEKQVTQWSKKDLKWFIEEYPKEQNAIGSGDNVRRIIRQAFHDWEKYSGLKFEMATDKKHADLRIKFTSKDHGDGYPFDGQGSTLAHAFYPTAGDIHFDNDEHFTDTYKNGDEQYNLRLVAAHEIGHALGLTHSYKEDSLMFPVYQSFQSDYNISKDDQNNIQELYGKPEDKTNTESTPRTTRSPSVTTHYSDPLPSNNWCYGGFDTGCEGPDGELYLFNDDLVWRYRAKTKRSWDPAPTLISERFPSLPDTTMTACVKSTTGYMYLFRNYRLWKLRTHWSADGPHILHGRHYPQNPRVALLHKRSIYLVRDHLVYRLNEVDHDRDLEIRTIDTILKPPPEEHIHSGFTYDKRHYIFTRDEVYVYDSTHGKLLPGYPKSATNGWFACEKATQASNFKKKTTPAYHRDNEREHHHHRDHHHHHHHRRPPPPPPHRHRHHHHHHSDEE